MSEPDKPDGKGCAEGCVLVVTVLIATIATIALGLALIWVNEW